MSKSLQYLDVPFVAEEHLDAEGSLAEGIGPEEMKAEVDETGYFKGWGAIFNVPDAIRDVVIPGAFTKSLKQGGHNRMGVAMLYMHDPHRPLGRWMVMREEKRGLWVEGQLAMGTKDGNDAHVFMKMGALKGMSIGFNTIIDEFDKVKKVHNLKELDLWEVSPVVFPMHLGAKITNVKSLETDLVWEFKDLIESHNTERKLESALRESGISKSAALYMVKLARPLLRESEEERQELAEREESEVRELLSELQALNINANK